ncbi:pleckstrin homology domain-containing family G member 3-like [Conger conger]|uniref:pleckstrin homology domain-containing family G member 3-like n=1 Tax=Conger conger TaxID=82655 RepID=UPI002A599217|nr:pleckstrin homology domain-containing family G member 3-like [Conger conger]
MPERAHGEACDIPMGEESPRLSTASTISGNDQTPTLSVLDYPVPLSSAFHEGQRPASLVSTISSGSGSGLSQDGRISDCSSATFEPTASIAQDNDRDVDLELSPAEGDGLTSERGQLDPQLKTQQKGNSNVGVQGKADRTHQRPLSPFAAMAPNPKLSYLDRVIMEILETERMYVRDLRSIVEDYLAHIIDTGNLPIQPEQVCALFGNIEDIYEFNSELLQSLDLCDNDPVAIARCFVLKSEYFEIYTQYCTNYPNSVAALTDCMRNKTLAKFFRDRQASLKRSLPLGSYLLKPVQRILKYHLLLQEIAKHFDPEEEGYEVVEEAIYTMTGVAWYINDMKRKHEHAVRLQEVQSLLINWKGPDLTTYGELVLEGTFRVYRAKSERTLFLFDKMILITKKRGEHYVYKAHISCSTLMLIESAKDCLCFSVTHYKHPKQPHTMLAKTVEEKKLWAHHIKRLILENHHALIPQKAKEAILERDSIYPTKYRYSPERIKRAQSSQLEDFPGTGRQGRRQSEPTKQITKIAKANLKRTDSDGALQANAWSVRPRDSVSTLGSSLGEPEDERPSLEEDERPSLEEDPGFGKNAYEQPFPSGREEAGPGGGEGGAEQAAEGESDKDDVLMEGDQVADFASSMLEAISCWHYRARALLSIGVPTKEEGNDIMEENGVHRESGHSSGQEETCDTMERRLLSKQGATEKQLAQSSCLPGSTEKLEQDLPSNFEAATMAAPISSAPSGLEECELKEDQNDDGDERMEMSPVHQQAEAKALSSEESSATEDDEDEEATAPGGEPASILPPSVLDQASVIAKHFTSSAQRGSLIDEVRSLGCPSPRLQTRRGSSYSLGAEAQERPQRPLVTCLDDPPSLLTPDHALLSTCPDNAFEADPRRDSTLSRQDQLLIGKIKSYYEHAEHHGASFTIKRRESLTYIPAGLVRSSVTRLNSIPKDDAAGPKKSPDSASGPASDISNPSDYHTSCAELDLQGPVEPFGSEANGDEEEFRPSSEMIRVWQEMEKDLGGPRYPRQGSRIGGTCPRLPGWVQATCGKPEIDHSKLPLALRETNPDADSEEPAKDPKSQAMGAGPGEEVRAKRAPIPRVIQLGSEIAEELDAERAKNKVFQLARQYSQRIKCSKPLVRQRSQDTDISASANVHLPPLLEERTEKESKGKPNLTLPLATYDQVVLRALAVPAKVRSPSPTDTASSAGSPRVPSPSRSSCRSPVSPTQSESFDWPDVRELRSMYAQGGPEEAQAGSGHIPAGRRRSVLEKMESDGYRRRSCCSSSYNVCPEAGTAPGPPSQPLAPRPCCPGNQNEGRARVCRAGSLDHRHSGLNLSNLHDLHNPELSAAGYYVSGHALLPNNHKVFVVERVTEAAPQEDGTDLGLAEEDSRPLGMEPEEAQDSDGNYVQIRSPTSREKISIRAVIDRCKAYQESDEYQQRQEGGVRVETTTSHGRDKKQEHQPSLSEQVDDTQRNTVSPGKKIDGGQNSVVKNLRDKFLNLRSNT